MNRTAVICVLRTGGDFCTCDVDVLYKNLQEHTTKPFDFYCLTDAKTNKFPTIPFAKEYKGWWAKIELFRPSIVPNERVLYFDLDTMITGNIDSLLTDVEHPFVGLRDFYHDRKPMPNNYVATGMLAFENSRRFDFLYNNFKYPADSIAFRGDQDYISSRLQHVHIQPVYWQDIETGICSYKAHIKTGLVKKEDARVVCFHGKPRPKEIDYAL